MSRRQDDVAALARSVGWLVSLAAFFAAGLWLVSCLVDRDARRRDREERDRILRDQEDEIAARRRVR